MELGATLEVFFKYILLPLLTAICTMGWHMMKKQDTRIDHLEARTSETEKAIIEIKTEFKFISRDIKEIKDILIKLSDR